LEKNIQEISLVNFTFHRYFCNFKERKELDNFLKTELTVPHIERIVTDVVLNVIKDEKRPLLD
jgi:hypothetical protein